MFPPIFFCLNTFWLIQPLDQWNVSKATSANGMFEWSGINQDLSSWNFPNLESIFDKLFSNVQVEYDQNT